MENASVSGDLTEAFPPTLPLAGEGAPALLVAVLAAVGAALAVVSASIWFVPPVIPPKPVTIVVREQAPPPPPPPPTIIRAPLPLLAPAVAPRAPCFDPVTLMFARDGAAPLAGAEAGVARLRDWLGSHAEGRLLVEGHADSFGGEAHNLALSFARAKSVASLLARNGVPAGRITVRAAGAAEAAANNGALNRRVVIGIEGLAACKSASGARERP
jgi:outer membrane protein OmpA-like peptidoglycan-associated protein